MSDYAFHPEAFGDLDELWEYIAQDNIDAADAVLADIRSFLRDLDRDRHPFRRPLRFRVDSDR